jgi:hypothetical protein
VHDYSKLFNHLAQYVSDQVDTDDKKKNRFMIGLSIKLQERMTLNMGGYRTVYHHGPTYPPHQHQRQ